MGGLAVRQELSGALRELRRQGRFSAARELLATALRDRPDDRRDDRLPWLAWQHEDFWWRPLQGRRVRLQRRGPADVALVRRCWADADFMHRFNRLATALPPDDAELQALLAREQAALPGETRALHWTLHEGAQSIGFASLVEISFTHRRAEFLMGVAGGGRPWAASEAAHLVLEFAAQRAKLERLTAHFYPENLAALRVAEKLGFEREGLLRGHLRLPGGGGRSDLIVAGLLLDSGWFERCSRQRRRLLGRG